MDFGCGDVFTGMATQELGLAFGRLQGKLTIAAHAVIMNLDQVEMFGMHSFESVVWPSRGSRNPHKWDASSEQFDVVVPEFER
jgi:hypothetical protein